ncbi:hypothetical protein [Aminipila sp.]|uniref:hypothetical protein n=1 Tax=Aminipila sp. TaxID=2060095 RepID=UPI0028999C75|nr:hypothetical protein [Aminipila sp.]
MITGRAIMQTVTLSEFCRIVKKRSSNRKHRRGVEPRAYGRKPWTMGRNWSTIKEPLGI